LIVFIKYTQANLDSPSERNYTELISTYRDLSQLQGGDNLYWTGQKFSYSLSELKDDAFYIASRECCYGIAQTYEIFESFLKSFLVELLQHKREYLELISNDESLTLNSTDDFRDLVNQFQKRGKNNKKFFWLFRKISDFYKRHEKENIWNYNMADWYDLMSEVRHAIIHNRQHFTDKVKTSIARNRNQIIFERYFNVEKSTDSGLIIVDRLKTGELINLFNQFAFLIWKSVSLDCGLELDYR
jgi:hypothetical protein